MAATTLETDRLLLRGWTVPDRDAFARLVGDPVAMRYYPETLSRIESDASADRMSAHLEAHGWGQWVVERREDGAFLGVAGLWAPTFEAHFTPCVEVGWRFLPAAWGHGYATEAGAAAIDHGFAVLGLDELVSMTTVANLPSRRVMERLGMTHDTADDFDHPRLPEDHPLRPHVLYRLVRARWALHAAAMDRQRGASST